MTTPAPTRLVTTAEACEQLGISLSKLYELIRTGEITSVVMPPSPPRRGARAVINAGSRPARRIEQAEIDAFIERNRVQA